MEILYFLLQVYLIALVTWKILICENTEHLKNF